MKNKIWPLSLIIMSLLSNNIYAADKMGQAIPSDAKIFISSEDENKKVEGLAVYSIGGYNYIKLRDIGYFMNYNITWDDKSKEIYFSKGNETAECPNTYIGTEVKNAVSVNQAIYANNEKYENLSAYNIDGFTYYKLRDIGEILNFSCTWDAETNSVIIDNAKDNTLEDVDYAAIDDFANNYLDDEIDKKIIDGYDCVYKRDSKDYTNITNYMRKNIDSNFVASDYIINEDTTFHLPYGYQKGINVLDIRLNVKGYSSDFGYRIYIKDNIAKIITTIRSMNDDFDITRLKVPNITDEELIDMAVKADHNSYEVSETDIRRYFDMDDLKFKSDVEVTYIDDSGCFFATLNVFELE
ncbi:hypothetical protein SDC9_113391 [bioreactor metagenome]|uniref:Copper amine oxidase-like N-terminal domain-containing protein n=1 Tax=bioreactor metagenome TaxID=1076179 RepID=A0A645BXN9_9ZZZZ|nr:copper amine oxidase N-terminal domain-containing protein [Candidatus Metalachnospira sp.]